MLDYFGMAMEEKKKDAMNELQAEAGFSFPSLNFCGFLGLLETIFWNNQVISDSSKLEKTKSGNQKIFDPERDGRKMDSFKSSRFDTFKNGLFLELLEVLKKVSQNNLSIKEKKNLEDLIEKYRLK
jgi:hypothetical protein